MNILSIYIGYITDLIVGDPYSFPHPVRYIGKLIRYVEKKVRKVAKTDKDLKIGGKHFKMKIPKHAKPNILKELNNLNINRGSLFLDLEHQISDIHNSIKKTDY